MVNFQTYYQIESKACEQGLNRLLDTALDLLIEEEKSWLRANGESTRKAKNKAIKTLIEWINTTKEWENTSRETLGDKFLDEGISWDDFKHYTPAYLFAKAFAILLKD